MVSRPVFPWFFFPFGSIGALEGQIMVLCCACGDFFTYDGLLTYDHHHPPIRV
jgi:hypothetical protein